jgi:hypothetical protein
VALFFIPHSEILYLAVLALIATWKFPDWGQRMLRLKRDWDSYREERQSQAREATPSPGKPRSD